MIKIHAKADYKIVPAPVKTSTHITVHFNTGQDSVYNVNAIRESITYLINWGLHQNRITTIDIYADREKDIVAVYRNETGGHIFTIGGVYDTETKKYSHHS